MWIVIVLTVLVGFAGYIMTPEERVRALAALRAAAARFPETARGGPASDPFAKALAERTRWPFVVPFIAMACVWVFLRIAFGAESGTDALIARGGNIGPLTTNGEWHRLLGAVFVHAGLFELLVNLAGLAAFGIIAERLVGSTALASVCVSAALAASLVSLAVNPLGLSTGASGAVLGMYGLLLASACRVFFATRDLLIPWEIAKPLAPLAGVFLLYGLGTSSMPFKADLAALLVGVVFGLVLSQGIEKGKPPLKRIGRLMAATAVLVLASAVLLAGIDDGRSELAAVAALEERTAKEYDAEVDRYRAGGTSADQLIRTIEGTIVPELQAAEERLGQLDKVPDDQRPSLAHAGRYLQQRLESWRLRIDGLRQRAILEARQSGQARTPSGDRQPPEQLLRSAALSLRQAEAAERNALDDLRAAVVILQ